MRLNLWTLGVVLGVSGAILYGANAQGATVSVNFGTSAFNLLPADTAGVVAVPNWNNGDTPGGGTIANLNNDTGSASGVGLTYVGGSMTNNINLTSSGSTPDNKMMAHVWNTHNEQSAQTVFYNSANNGVGNTGTRAFQQLSRVGTNGPRDNTAVFTNLNTAFPGGYDVYVYVSGAGSSPNEVAGSSPTSVRNFVAPVHVLAGGSGLINAVNTNNTGFASFPYLQFGTNNPVGAGGGTGKSIQDPANLPAGTQRTILWPAVFKPIGGGIPSGPTAGGYYSSDFQGFVAGGLNVTDAYPLDYGPLNEWGMSINYDPSLWANYPYNSDYAAASIWEPTFRGIPLANYIKFSGLSLDTLEILARNVHGVRTNNGSSDGFDMGGITGIQIVGLEVAEVVPEPSTYALMALGLAGLGLVGWRKRRRA